MVEVRYPAEGQRDPAQMLIANGVVLDVQVHIPTSDIELLTEQRRPVPPAVRCRALLDTGATGTLITNSIATQLELRTVGSWGLQGVNAESRSIPVVRGSLACGRAGLGFTNRSLGVVAELRSKDPEIKVLLGRDVLCFARLVYDGPAGRVTVEFP